MLGREDLDVNKLVYATDIDTMLVDCEGTKVWPQDGDGNEYYFKSQADKVMDSMERRIARLTALVEGWKKNSVVLGEMYHKRLDSELERIQELEKTKNERLKVELKQTEAQDQVVIDGLRNENAKLKCLALHAMSELFYWLQDKYFRDGTCALSWEEKEMLDKRGGKYLNLRCKYLDAYRKAKVELREGK